MHARRAESLADWITLQTPRPDPFIAEVIAGAAIPQDFPHVRSDFGAIFGAGTTALEELDKERAGQLARGLGHLAGVVLERGMSGEVAELEELFQGIRVEHRNALLRGVGEQLAIAGEAPRIPSSARRLKAPEGESVLVESFEKIVRRVWGDEADRVLAEANLDH